ncbi:MAG: hypothetical protein K940chlam3_00169 [Chlamydiae bacterium]|nr:hypothetical protein [Chlamydiota bacterium]
MSVKWYVLQVLSGQEKKTKRSIEEQAQAHNILEYIEEVLLPTENVSEVKHGEQKVVEKKLWPGYLLIKMDLNDDSFQYVKNVNGVVAFLGGAVPTYLTDKEVEEILKDLHEKKETITQKHQFQVGSTVKIIEGPFVNFLGTITELFHDKGRLNVMVSIFGRDTCVKDLDFADVEEVEEDYN